MGQQLLHTAVLVKQWCSLGCRISACHVMYNKGKGKASTYSICPELGEQVEFASPIVDVSPIESCLLCEGEQELTSVFLVGPLSLIDGLLRIEFGEGISQKRTHRVSISSQQSHSLKMVYVCTKKGE